LLRPHTARVRDNRRIPFLPRAAPVTDRTASNAPPAPGALAGLRVLDLSRVLAGPLCGQMLGDHGADVIKIEPPAGDETRALGPPFDAAGDAAYVSGVNRSKRGLALDLAKPAGRDVLLRLLERADVLLENFLPGTMERWGMGYEQALAACFPRLVYCAISGFGADGPLGGLPGYDAVAQALGGAMSLNGTETSGALRTAIPVVDIVTGYNAFAGILLALRARDAAGRGQRVEATLYDSALAMMIPFAANWMASGRTPARVGNAHTSIYPYDKFAVGRSEMFLGVVNPGQWRRFCEHVGRADLLADARFATNADRVANRAALRAELETTLAKYDAERLGADLMAQGVPAGPVNDIAQAFAHPHTAHRAMDVRIDDYRGTGVPVKLARTPGAPRAKPPRFAEHAAAILAEAGYSAAEIEALRTSGVAPSVRRKA
jgi:crotonobetainyl-CoA:carnitine CoA-transferase CaiB-like acyl-CoA transferase